MKSIRMPGVALVAAILLVSCASVAHVEKDESVDFTRYRTFAWIESKESDTAGKKYNDLMEKNIRAAVSKELQEAGWQESKRKPDVLLSYDVSVEQNTKERNDPVYSQSFTRTYYNPYTRRFFSVYYPSRYLGNERSAYSVREGTVTISMIDAKTEKTIWQGWTTGEVNSKNLTNKEIQTSVRNIFRKFDLAKN